MIVWGMEVVRIRAVVLFSLDTFSTATIRGHPENNNYSGKEKK